MLGMTSEKWKNGKETWWWNEEVQESIKEKKEAKKTWDLLQDEVSRKNYKVARKKASRVVAKARADACEELYDKLETKEGERQLYRLAKQRDRTGRDVQQVRVIKDADGNVLTRTEAVLGRWKDYFERLMSEENERKRRTEEMAKVWNKWRKSARTKC